MAMKYNNQDLTNRQGALFGVSLALLVALLGGFWFISYRAYTQTPAHETITVELPATESRAAETVEVIREIPGRQYLGALLHPFGFMILLLAIIAAGGILSLAFLGVRYGRQ